MFSRDMTDRLMSREHVAHVVKQNWKYQENMTTMIRLALSEIYGRITRPSRALPPSSCRPCLDVTSGLHFYPRTCQSMVSRSQRRSIFWVQTGRFTPICHCHRIRLMRGLHVGMPLWSITQRTERRSTTTHAHFLTSGGRRTPSMTQHLLTAVPLHPSGSEYLLISCFNLSETRSHCRESPEHDLVIMGY